MLDQLLHIGHAMGYDSAAAIVEAMLARLLLDTFRLSQFSDSPANWVGIRDYYNSAPLIRLLQGTNRKIKLMRQSRSLPGGGGTNAQNAHTTACC